MTRHGKYYLARLPDSDQWFVLPTAERDHFEAWADRGDSEDWPWYVVGVLGPEGLTFDNPKWGTDVPSAMFPKRAVKQGLGYTYHLEECPKRRGSISGCICRDDEHAARTRG